MTILKWMYFYPFGKLETSHILFSGDDLLFLQKILGISDRDMSMPSLINANSLIWYS